MNATDMRIQALLDKLREEIGSDLSSLAVVDPRDRHTRWRWASGNRNDRYLSIRIRHGQGFEGEVVKVGRALAWNDANGNSGGNLYAGYSILLTERLRSAFAAPVMAGTEVAGILLAGDRGPRAYGNGEREAVLRTSREMAEIVRGLV
ncbi:GAF domain-containing protein [Paenibacillaceae bacterium WGS1546]|uniref:GAF domain-containing protein n=1 Tax=Cohnella sp. WGS1546 TaxID=3366810 RepID=UPI00372D830D